MWSAIWEEHKEAPVHHLTELGLCKSGYPEVIVMPAPTHLKYDQPRRQRGGRPLTLNVLHSFFDARNLSFRGDVSSPLTAHDAYSRLSAYLTKATGLTLGQACICIWIFKRPSQTILPT